MKLSSATVTGHKVVGDHTEFDVAAVVVGADGTESTHRSQHRYSSFCDVHKAIQPKLPSLPPAFPVGKSSSDAAKRAEGLGKYLGTLHAALDAAAPPEELLQFLHVPLASLGATEFKLLTFNLGLLRVRMLGMTAFGSPPFTEERFHHIPEAIKGCGADVVALQVRTPPHPPEMASTHLESGTRGLSHHPPPRVRAGDLRARPRRRPHQARLGCLSLCRPRGQPEGRTIP